MNFENHVSTPSGGSASKDFAEVPVMDRQPGLTDGQGPSNRSTLGMIPAERPPFGKQLSPS